MRLILLLMIASMAPMAWTQDNSLSADDLAPATGIEEIPAVDAPKKINRNPRQSVLNFEGDMIEGEKRQPDLFVQTNVQNLDLDSVLYLRKNFNDFHVVDSKRRPRHFRTKGTSQ